MEIVKYFIYFKIKLKVLGDNYFEELIVFIYKYI